MAPTSPKSPKFGKNTLSDTETLILGQSPRSLRSASSPGRASSAGGTPSQSPKTQKGKSVKSSPSKSPKPSPSQSSKGRIASPKVKPVKKIQSKGSLKQQVKAFSVMRKSKRMAAGSPSSSSSPGSCTNKEIEEKKKAKWEEAMVEIRADFDAMKDYNKSHGCDPYTTWKKFLDIVFHYQGSGVEKGFDMFRLGLL